MGNSIVKDNLKLVLDVLKESGAYGIGKIISVFSAILVLGTLFFRVAGISFRFLSIMPVTVKKMTVITDSVLIGFILINILLYVVWRVLAKCTIKQMIIESTRPPIGGKHIGGYLPDDVIGKRIVNLFENENPEAWIFAIKDMGVFWGSFINLYFSLKYACMPYDHSAVVAYVLPIWSVIVLVRCTFASFYLNRLSMHKSDQERFYHWETGYSDTNGNKIYSNYQLCYEGVVYEIVEIPRESSDVEERIWVILPTNRTFTNLDKPLYLRDVAKDSLICIDSG